jgi:3',5'-nucleoside bisphosphate phosphatase
MHIKLRATLSMALTVCPAIVFAHSAANAKAEGDRVINFPDVQDMQTLVVDLHTHSVFSDGHVWPKIRVEESIRDGLDAMAVTEHLEYQPHRADIPHADRNRSFTEAVEAAKNSTLLVISGSEITRDAPAGHMNAIFVQDSNKLLKVPADAGAVTDAVTYYKAAHGWPADEAVKAANAQGAFVFWNHPYWTAQNADGIARLDDFHAGLIKAGQLHGIEIANGDDYSEEAHAIAMQHDLVMLGVSDVHDLIDWDYGPLAGGHRPVTLVFTADRSIDGIRKALFARQNVVWFKNLLVGRAPELMPLLRASLTVDASTTRFQNADVAIVTLQNHSDAEFMLQNKSAHTFMGSADMVTVPAHGRTELAVKIPKGDAKVSLEFSVLNALVAPKQPAVISFTALLPPRA